jgi:hypothetical protein
MSNTQERARRAEALLADPVLIAAFRAAERRIFEAWKISTMPEQRETLHAEYRALRTLEAGIQRFVNDGAMEPDDE